MANIKNFGLNGVAADLQLGKAGPRVVNSSGTFGFKAADGTTDAPITASTLTLGGDATLSRSAAGVLQANGSAAFLLPSGNNAAQPTGAVGMIRVNTQSAPVVEYYNGSAWAVLSSSGSIVTLQAEVDAIEVSLGSGIASDGTFVAGSFVGAAFATPPTSFTNAINEVAAYAEGHDTLDEIFAPGSAGNVIYSSGSAWLQAAPGATSGVQAYDAKLASLSSNATGGIIVQDSSTTVAARTLVQPAAGLTISNADGVAGNPTFALANDLAALEGLTTTGYIIRTGNGTATTRAIAGTAGNIAVTNGDGVSSDTTINLATVSQAASGNFVKVTLDGFGRVTGNTAVVTADLTGLLGSTYLLTDGTRALTGNLSAGGNNITSLADPVDPQDAATKNYVDNAVSGITWKTAVLAATTANITLSGAQTIDGVSVVAGNRVLVKNQTTTTENGIYVAASGAWARSSDAASGAQLDDAAVFVQQGTVNADSGWVQTASNVVIGTTPIVWVQFSGAGSYTGGTGIDITGNVISAKLGAGIASVPTGEIGIDLYNASTGALILTTDGSTRSTATGAALSLLLDGAGALAQTSSGLKVNAASVTNAMLVNSSVGLNGDSGSSTLALGQTLQVTGTSTQGIVTSVSGQTVNITASNASSSQKGVATFNTASFATTAGDVTIKAAGVTNTQLVNSTTTFAGNTGTPTAVALGGTVTVRGDGTLITSAATANQISFSLGTVDVAHGGTGFTTLNAVGAIPFGNTGSTALTNTANLVFTDSISLLQIGGTTNYLALAGASNTIGSSAGVSFNLASSTLQIAGLSAATYATNVGTVGNNAIPNKKYVDDAITAHVVDVAHGGTGQTSLDSTAILTGNGTSGINSNTKFTLTDNGSISVLTLGGVSSSYMNFAINGSLNQISSNAGIQFALSAGNVIAITSSTATEYKAAVISTGDNAVPNKKYVDDAISSAITAVSGDVKAYKATVPLTNGTVNIGSALPANATVLRVKINVTAAATAGTLAVGVSGNTGRYADTGSNDPLSTGLYISETYDTDASSVQVIATVASATGSGSANVLVEYMLA